MRDGSMAGQPTLAPSMFQMILLCRLGCILDPEKKSLEQSLTGLVQILVKLKCQGLHMNIPPPKTRYRYWQRYWIDKSSVSAVLGFCIRYNLHDVF